MTPDYYYYLNQSDTYKVDVPKKGKLAPYMGLG